MTEETALKKQIKQYLDTLGIFNFHIMAGMGAFKGSPDRIAVLPNKVLFIEAKSKKGNQSLYQLNFEQNICKTNHIYILAKSLEDVQKVIRKEIGRG